MKREQALLDPLLDARDVFETFLVVRLELPEWQPTLLRSAAKLVELAPNFVDRDLAKVAEHIRAVADVGLRDHESTARHVATEVAMQLATIRVPGRPVPEDQEWAF